MTAASDGDHHDSEPLRLDLRADSTADVGDVRPESRAPGRPRWAWLIAAFALGAVVSLVVADARRAVDERSTIEVVIGAQEVSGDSPTTLEYAVLNVGPQSVRILHVVPVGWVLASDESQVVTAEPGQWTTVPTVVNVDCDVRPDATATVTARSAAGERSAETTLPSDINDDLLVAWSEACPARPVVEIDAGLVEPTRTTDDVMTGIVWMEPQGTEDSVEVVNLGSRNAGFTAVAPNLPMELPVGVPSDVTVQWRVIDCDQALRLTDARLDVTLATPEPRAFRVNISLDAPATLALARFSGSVCGT